MAVVANVLEIEHLPDLNENMLMMELIITLRTRKHLLRYYTCIVYIHDRTFLSTQFIIHMVVEA